MQRLKDGFPLETDFGPREAAERTAKQTGFNILLGKKEVYTPATEEEIAKYQDEAFPKWLIDCEQMLRNHNRTLQRKIPVLEFSFLAMNRGNRPATDALITLEARGNFQIKPPLADYQDDEQDGESDDVDNGQSTVLPRPPVAPVGHWRRPIGSYLRDTLRGLDAFTRLPHSPSVLAYGTDHMLKYPWYALHSVNHRLVTPIPSITNPASQRIRRPHSLSNATSGRHDDVEERFLCEIHVPTDQDNAEGEVGCRIQAANLSKPVSKHMPVRIEITHVSAFESAQKMVKALLRIPTPLHEFFGK